MQAKGYAFSVIGGREMNQDSFLVNDAKHLYAIADGVGGGLSGDVASQMAVAGLDARFNDPGQRLTEIFFELQKEVLGYSMTEYGDALMGTTLTAAAIRNDSINVCHVGDSRCYHYTQSTLRLLTEDQEFYDEALKGSVLASYLGIPNNTHPIRITEEAVALTPGDRILICSDGLYRQMTEPRMVTLIRTHLANPAELVEALCTEASQKDHSDNVTVVYVEIE